MINSNYDEIADLSHGKPHVVILGAGASLAAFPYGDSDGRVLPIMDNLVEVLGLGPTLDSMNIEYASKNFEEIYSELHQRGDSEEIVKIEKHIESYFSQMRLPESPTLYDHLVLSLRKKDLIATFNWDPFLFLAHKRNYDNTDMPKIVFLHGNVAIGVCEKHKRFGPRKATCPICGANYEPVGLLYPVSRKNYTAVPFIEDQWKLFRFFLANAYILTIFGYGAPESDVEAIALIKEAWGSPNNRSFEQIEMIDVKPEDQLKDTWGNLIFSHHYDVIDDFYSSTMARHPRRSCEVMWQRLMECQFIAEDPIPKNAEWDDLYRWLEPRLIAERKAN